MNVYDFDGTLYAGDSTADFVAFLMKRHPALLLRLPAIGLAFLKLLIRVSTKTQAKETLYSIFQSVKDMPGEVTLFWAAHGHKLKKWYASKKKPDDLVISASPVFLVKPGCALLGIHSVIASQVDIITGKYSGANCHGEEKIARLYACYPEARVADFYSDSHADDPLARLARRAYMVTGETLTPWKIKK